jgi:hypothetical protein
MKKKKDLIGTEKIKSLMNPQFVEILWNNTEEALAKIKPMLLDIDNNSDVRGKQLHILITYTT